MKYQEIEGDLIKLALMGNFDVIARDCHCETVMDKDLVKKLVEAFSGGNSKLKEPPYENDINKLGTIEYNISEYRKMKDLTVVNAYVRFTNDTDKMPKLDYQALTLCLRKINHIFKGKHIGFPILNYQLDGGIWDHTKLPINNREYHHFFERREKDVKTIIQEELKDVDITIVNHKRNIF